MPTTASPQVEPLVNNPEAAASTNVTNVTVQPTGTKGGAKAPNTKKRSVNNMKPDALLKKRENDRNAQRNIREKQRRNLSMLQQKVISLQKAQDQQLLIHIEESDDLITRLLTLLTQHGISTRAMLSPEQFDQFGSLVLDQPGPRPCYQSQQYSPMSQHYPPVSQQMYSVGPHQAMLQSPVQYMMASHTGSSPTQFIGSPESMGSSLDTPPRPLTQSSQLSCQSQPIQHMRAMSHMGSGPPIGFPHDLPVRGPPAFSPMENAPSMATTPLVSNTHPMAHTNATGMMASSPDIKFEETGFHPYPPMDEEWYNAQNHLAQSQPQPQLQPWDHSPIFRPDPGAAFSAETNPMET